MTPKRLQINYMENTSTYHNSVNVSQLMQEGRDKSIVLVFTADWVSSSSIVDVVCKKIANERSDVKLVKINVDSNKDLIAKYRIKKVPSCVIIQKQEITDRIEGAFSKKDVLDKISI